MKILYLPNEYSQQRQREKKRFIYPVHMAMEAEYYRKLGHEVHWGVQPVNQECWAHKYDKVVELIEGIPFNVLPWPDRVFTKAFDPKYQSNGNFKYLPGTYIQSSSGCWWGKCEFCVEKKNNYVVREVKDVYGEILECKRLGFKEIFDDSSTLPTGLWLDKLLSLPKPGVTMGCNMRLVDVDYKAMKKWGFRMVLMGIESANQGTLDRISKGTKTSDIQWVIKAAEAGLDTHGAFMFGYPWESKSDAINTLELAHELLRKGHLKTAQASFYNPPKDSIVYKVGKYYEQNNPAHKKYVKKLYDVAYYPDFWINKLKDIKNFSDVKYLFRQVKEGLGL